MRRAEERNCWPACLCFCSVFTRLEPLFAFFFCVHIKVRPLVAMPPQQLRIPLGLDHDERVDVALV
jgi:hypothetical protein